MAKLSRPLAFVDLETTGAAPARDRITEVAIITWDGERQEAWSQLVNPETGISSFIEKLTGISDAMVKEAPRFAQLAGEIARRLEGHLFIAHNARFDYSFLKNEFKRVGIDFCAPTLCTVKYSRRLYPEFSKHNLDSLVERHGLHIAQRHRALGDAQAIFDFWQIVEARFPAEQLEKIQKEQLGRASLPPHIDGDLLDAIPDGHGVYLFYGENDLPLYVGSGKQLRQQVLTHFAADQGKARERALSGQIRRIDWRECAGEIDALLTETRLIKDLQPTLNRPSQRHREYWAWQLVERGDGALQARLIEAGDLDLGNQSRIYGLFAGSKEASAVLKRIAHEKVLCLSVLGLEEARAGKPCAAWASKRCRGACCGKESLMQHSLRLMDALEKLRLRSWPFKGPAQLPEGEVRHVVDAWCYLGRARTDAEVETLLQNGRPPFERDIYRILVKQRERMQAI